MRYIFICLLSLYSLTNWAQTIETSKLKTTIDYKCPCAKIGLDSIWAEKKQVSCYLIPVQRDILEASISTFNLAVAVVKSDQETGDDPIVYLHGGPGISTLSNLPQYLDAPAWEHLKKNKDLIFFDYRGTGFSEPDLCKVELEALLQFKKTNPEYEDYATMEIQEYKNCKENLSAAGINLSSFTSFQMASDAEEIRKALHIKKWNMYGVSYGTFIGMSYMKNFPDAINSVILDSPFPPNVPWLDFVRPVDTAFNYLQKKLLENAETSKQFPSFRKDFAQAVDRLNTTPVKIDSINFDGNDFAWSVYYALVKSKKVRLVPLAVQEVANGNNQILQKWQKINSIESFGTYSQAQEWAVLCYENRVQDPQALQNSLAEQFPELRSFNQGYNIALCDVFRPEQPDPEIFEPVNSAIPTLILSGGFDPATPPIFGTYAKTSLTNATHVIIPLASHAVLHFDYCVYNAVADFLSNPEVNPQIDCIQDHSEIEFVTDNLMEALENYKN